MAETSFSQALGRLSASHPEFLAGPNCDSWKADKGVHEESRTWMNQAWLCSVHPIGVRRSLAHYGE